MTEIKERNTHVDIMRGVAILLVVLNHTMTGCTSNSQDSFLFNIVWSLQMPLFILISGYVTRYSKRISSGGMLWSYVKRRTMAYLLPWTVWTFLVRGVLLGRVEYFNPKSILWNMDSGYWFLISIWTISLIFGVSSYLANRMTNKKQSLNGYIRDIIITGIFYMAGMAILAVIGLLMGLSFFCIKLTLYYMPFYFAGYTYGKLQDQINESTKGRRLTQIVVAVSLFAWLAIILRINLYTISDSGIGILIRAFASLAGCIAVCGLTSALFSKNQTGGGSLSWCGIHSLEIYIAHYYFLTLMKPEIMMEANSLAGIITIALNYAVTIILTVLVIKLLNANHILRTLLFGKTQ